MSWFGIYLYHVTNCSSAPRYWNNNEQQSDFDLVHVWLVFDHIAEAKAKAEAEAGEGAGQQSNPSLMLCAHAPQIIQVCVL